MILISLSIEKYVFSRRLGATALPSDLLHSHKFNLYLASSLETVMREPALNKLLTFHNSNLITIFSRLGSLSKVSVQVRGSFRLFVTNLFFYDEGLLTPFQPPSCKTTPCRLSAAPYLIYSQLPSIAGGRSSIRNPRTRHAVGTGTHLCYISVFINTGSGIQKFIGLNTQTAWWSHNPTIIF
jgi:hypothetical protein